MKALVVDDSMLIRHTVCRWLEERGFAVEAACNGAEALETMAAYVPDVIITDMEMPQMTGPELIFKLRSQPHTADIPIVILAGKRSALSMGAQCRAHYTIFKDIDIETQLQHAVTSLAAKRTGN
ncbi:MAG TPA: response regulator [Terriglobales bacterium]|nr:response regulator [Terriglobales bacterium]